MPSPDGRTQTWFARSVGEPDAAWLPVIEVAGDVVATAIGTLELGVPNPHCVRGRSVRLANVVTAPDHRGHGFGTLLVREVTGGRGRSMRTGSTSAPRRTGSGSMSGQVSS